MGGQAPAPVDWKGIQTGITDAASQQTANNRLNTSSPFASQTFGEDGSVSSQFAGGEFGGLGQAAAGLQQQVAGLAKPMDWSQFGTVGTGDQARQQAIDASYGQATSRLDPQWNQRQDSERTRLMNQGLDPSSEAFRGEMDAFGRQRNDAYSSAMNGAIGQGTAAGDSAFRNNLLSQQSAIANALRQRGMPMQEMQQLMGFLGQQPQYNADSSTLAGAMGSAGIAQNVAEQERRDAQAKADEEAQLAGAGMGAAGGLAGLGLALALMPKF